MKKRVVITGIGPVTSLGIGKDIFWKKLLSGDSPEIKKVLDSRMRSKVYVPLPDFTLTDYEIPNYYKFLQPEDKMAIIAAKLALEDAGFVLEKDRKRFRFAGNEKIATIIGTGFTGLETAFTSYLSHLGVDLSEKHKPFNRMVIPRLMTNSPAAWISILFGLQGESFSLNASCASGTFALGQAFRQIADGYAELVVSGGVENLHDEKFSIFRGFDVLGALTKTDSAKPFCHDRSGFLFAEGGSCMLILEELEHAKKRDAKIYAEILDYQSNSDAHNIVQIDPSGKSIIKLFQKLVGEKKIDYLNAHGTATITNDEIEAKAIIKYFGNAEKQPVINSTKGIFGHTIGASGAIEAAVTALSVYHDCTHSNQVGNRMKNLNIPAAKREIEIQKAISVSYGFGGHNSGLLLGKYHG